MKFECHLFVLRVKPFFKDDVQGQLQGARSYDGLKNVDNASTGGLNVRQKTTALEQSTCIGQWSVNVARPCILMEHGR